MFSRLRRLVLGDARVAGGENSAATAQAGSAVAATAKRQEEDDYTGERVDWTALLPVDLLLRVVLCLEGAEDVLAASHVATRLRRVFFVRNVWGRWLARRLPARLGSDCFFLALDDPDVPAVEDPFAAVAGSVSDLRPFLPWAFGCLRVQVKEAFEQLARGQMGGKDVFGWNQLRNDGGAVAQVALLLPPGSHPPVWVSPRTLGLSRLLMLGVPGAATVLSNDKGAPGHNYNCLTVVGNSLWNKLTEQQKLQLSHDGPPDLSVECRRMQLLPSPDVPGVFACRACGPQVALVLRSCRVAGSILSGCIVDRGARLVAEDTDFEACKQNGVYAYESGLCEMRNCNIRKCGTYGISVSLVSIGTSTVLLQGCTVTMDKETTGIVLRTRARPCNIAIRVERCRVLEAYSGIIYWPRGSDDDEEDQPKRHAEDDPIMECEHDGCPGAVVELIENVIPNPRNHGMSLGTPICPSNKTRCFVARNTINHCRPLAILVSMPDQEKSSGVTLLDNQLTDTGEQRVLSFPGLRQCLEQHRCSRNVTGKRYELQAFFRCRECKLLPSNNLGVCASCAEVCHKGHAGLYLYAVVGAYCDCPERKEKCCIFEKDPLYKEDKPEDY